MEYTAKTTKAAFNAAAGQASSATALTDNRPSSAIQRKQAKALSQGDTIQMRKAVSRNHNRRTFKLPGAVANHIFDNSNDGTGFHSVARNPHALLPHVQQTDARNRNTQAYRANHLDNGNHVVAHNKSMFPDNWTVAQVTDTVEKAFTKPDVTAAEKVRINKHGTTEGANRALPNPIKGRANGLRIEGISNAGVLATAYPIVR